MGSSGTRDRREARRRSRSRSGSVSSAYSSSSYSSGSSSGSRTPPSRTRPRSPEPRKIVAGPTLPPGFVRERTPQNEHSHSEEEEDDYVGPSLPVPVFSASNGDNDEDGALNSGAKAFLEREARRTAAEAEAQAAAERAANSRPEWMLLPPSLSNASSLQAVAGDPLNLKSRGFAQSTPRVSAKGGRSAGDADGDMSLWTETPEERQKRLQEEVSGIQGRDASGRRVGKEAALEAELRARRDAAIAADMQKADSGRKSLLKEHNDKRKQEMLEKQMEDKRRDERRAEKRRRREEDRREEDDRDEGRPGSSSKRKDEDEYRRHRHKRSHRSDSRERTEKDRHRHSDRKDDDHERDHKLKHRSSRHTSHRSHESNSHRSSRHRSVSPSDEERRRRRRERKERDKEKEQQGDDRKRNKSRKEREEQEVREGKSAAPMIWDREAALSIGGRLMDEKKRTKLVADANALGDRFGSGSRRFL